MLWSSSASMIALGQGEPFRRLILRWCAPLPPDFSRSGGDTLV
jgi:hypothetical protein